MPRGRRQLCFPCRMPCPWVVRRLPRRSRRPLPPVRCSSSPAGKRSPRSPPRARRSRSHGNAPRQHGTGRSRPRRRRPRTVSAGSRPRRGSSRSPKSSLVPGATPASAGRRGSSPRSATRIRSGARRRSSSPTRCGPSWRTPAFQRTAASSTRWPFSPRAHRGGPPHPVARSQAPHDEPGPQALPRGLGTARRAPTPLPRHPPDVPHPLPGQGAQDLEEFRGPHPKNSHGGGGNRTRVRKPSALRPYVRSPRFEVGRRTGTDALPATPSRNSLAVQGPGSPGRPARILTVNPEPTGRDPGDRALGLFKQPARAQRCRWLLCRCLRDLRVSGPLGTRPRASVPPSKPGRPLQLHLH